MRTLAIWIYCWCHVAFYCAFKGDTEKSSYCVTTWKACTKNPSVYYYAPHMQLLSVDFSFKAVCFPTVQQVLILAPRMSHHQSTSGMERQSPFGLLSVMVSSSPMTRPLTGCRLWVRLPAWLYNGFSRRDTDRRRGRRQMRGQIHRGRSSGTATKQRITPAHHAISPPHAGRYT